MTSAPLETFYRNLSKQFDDLGDTVSGHTGNCGLKACDHKFDGHMMANMLWAMSQYYEHRARAEAEK
jgi:hypothetical protein